MPEPLKGSVMTTKLKTFLLLMMSSVLAAIAGANEPLTLDQGLRVNSETAIASQSARPYPITISALGLSLKGSSVGATSVSTVFVSGTTPANFIAETMEENSTHPWGASIGATDPLPKELLGYSEKAAEIRRILKTNPVLATAKAVSVFITTSGWLSAGGARSFILSSANQPLLVKQVQAAATSKNPVDPIAVLSIPPTTYCQGEAWPVWVVNLKTKKTLISTDIRDHCPGPIPGGVASGG